MQNFSDHVPHTRHLTKDEELALGAQVQAYKAVKDKWESGNLTYTERRELYPIVSAGQRAVDTLVRHNIGLVKSRARNYKNKYPSSPDMEDLIQEGMAGLMRAVWKYDPLRGNKFSTLAHYWICQVISRESNKTGKLVRLPENRVQNLTHMNKLANSEEARFLSQSELDQYLMNELNLSKHDYASIRDAASTPASLNKVVGSEGDSNKELIDFVAVKHTEGSSEEEMLREEMKRVLLREVANLSKIEKAVILSTFNINGDSPTPEEVRGAFELQPFRFKKVQTQAINQLRSRLEEKGYSLSDFLALQ